LAYSPFKVGQTTLDEEWRLPPRLIIGEPLPAAAGGFRPLNDPRAVVCTNLDDILRAHWPPIESSLLTGPEGSAIVLVNHGYKPIKHLLIVVKLPHPVLTAISTEGAAVRVRGDGDFKALEMPLEWTDIVLLPKQ